jgi:hypothetical protein
MLLHRSKLHLKTSTLKWLQSLPSTRLLLLLPGQDMATLLLLPAAAQCVVLDLGLAAAAAQCVALADLGPVPNVTTKWLQLASDSQQAHSVSDRLVQVLLSCRLL